MIYLWSMNQHKHTIQLSKKERSHLDSIIHKGKRNTRVVTRARILLRSHEGIGKDALAKELGIGRSTVQRIRDRYRDGGMTHALEEDPRSGQPKKLNDKAESYLIATACSEPPEGSDHWTLELLAQQLMKEKRVQRISSVAVMHYLHRNDVKPWREKNVVYSGSNPGVH